MKREGGNGERRCLEETYLSEGTFLQDVADFRNDLTLVCPGKNLFSPSRVFQCCLKSVSGTVKLTFLDLAFRLTMKWNPPSGY